MRSLTSKLNNVFVKIGGVEAVNDIYSCIELCVDEIIAPMVETKFGIKFIDIFDKLKLKHNPHLSNIETKSGVKNLKEIKTASGKIDNITVEGDLSASYFNKNTNSRFKIK